MLVFLSFSLHSLGFHILHISLVILAHGLCVLANRRRLCLRSFFLLICLHSFLGRLDLDLDAIGGSGSLQGQAFRSATSVED